MGDVTLWILILVVGVVAVVVIVGAIVVAPFFFGVKGVSRVRNRAKERRVDLEQGWEQWRRRYQDVTGNRAPFQQTAENELVVLLAIDPDERIPAVQHGTSRIDELMGKIESTGNRKAFFTKLATDHADIIEPLKGHLKELLIKRIKEIELEWPRRAIEIVPPPSSSRKPFFRK